MNVVETTAPIGLEDLKKYFNDKTLSYVLDYEQGKLKGSKLLTYISNLDIPIDVKFDPESEEGQQLLKEYMESNTLVSISSVEQAVGYLLLMYRHSTTKTKFMEDNKDLFDHWSMLLDSCTLYNVYTVDDDSIKDWVKSHEEQKFEVVKGINFVHLLKYTSFFDFFKTTEEQNCKYLPEVFNDYIFKGNNLYNYWANDNNPMFLFTQNLFDETSELTPQKFSEAIFTEKENVTPI
jgi:hypothetical protein